MSPVRFRPELRLPWQTIAGFAVVVYILRSALRGWDFTPTLLDAMVFGGLAAILLLRPLIARSLKDDDEDS